MKDKLNQIKPVRRYPKPREALQNPSSGLCPLARAGKSKSLIRLKRLKGGKRQKKANLIQN